MSIFFYLACMDKLIEIGPNKVKLVKETTDPMATRISIGGKDNLFYFVYRGDEDEVMRTLQVALQAFAEREGQ